MAAMGGVPEFPASRGLPVPWAVGRRAASGPRSRGVTGCRGAASRRPVRAHWRRQSPAAPTAGSPGVARPKVAAPPAESVRAAGSVRPDDVWLAAVAGDGAVRPAGFTGSRRRRRGVRLTRRGRLVLLALFVALTALTAVLVASASRAADPEGPHPAAVVRPGDTLWSVAQRHVPSRDPFGVIEEIRRLNGLPDYTVQPGQELLLPHGG